MIEFDSGFAIEPFASLCRNFPGSDVYPSKDFRVEWGPIFCRGRLDGTARVLVIGQDPAAHEAVVRRILVGVAGMRAQGFLAKLGIQKSYVFINTFLYSVYGQQGGEKHKNDAAIAAYRNKWLDALLVGMAVEAVVALGQLADHAWKMWKATTNGATVSLPYQHITHHTQPDSSSGGDPAKLAAETKKLLTNWNSALSMLQPKILHPDVTQPLVPYGTEFVAADLSPIPSMDLPAGLPAWMRRDDSWARRTGATAAKKRATITITVPSDALE